jgi:hypothetical protein
MATVDITWTSSSDSHDGERVYRSTTSSSSFPSDYTQIADIAANTGSYTDSNAPDGDTVDYAVGVGKWLGSRDSHRHVVRYVDGIDHLGRDISGVHGRLGDDIGSSECGR